ncbi:TonB-dependent receptor [Olivibacter sp. SDN3]|uniref:SusC/RagA family TonB-linked outer membrane protein n=1 Tax=Olivibacter sp. SDN3 TaxID=2764720 RepID=UPI00165100F9|nr:TonB-dependent receptor [Olivibacter sp. SDN3]QNL51575.1 TonB-dependent receptor [Olivibacter sp. SDN3]
MKHLITFSKCRFPITALLAFMMLMLGQIARAQGNRSITGAVSDPQGELIPGVSVFLTGTGDYKASTITNANGLFTFDELPNNGPYTLTFTYVGFEKQTLTGYEVKAGEKVSVTVTLNENISDLDEVIVTGYGTQRRKEVTGAVSTIGPKEIENIPVQSFDRAMQGQAAGVQINAASGVPGAPVQMNIRGVGSITAGTQPLFIIDGVQMNSTTTTSTTASNPLAFLNNNDIESITVLKDAAAASIYGAQAANGVVLITTKKGKSGHSQINFNTYVGRTAPMPKVDMMNAQQMIQARMEAIANRYPSRTAEANRENALTGLGLDPELTDAQIAALPTYDWQDAAFRNGSSQNYELSFSGGTEKTTIFLSGSYNKQEGAVIGLDFNRATAKANISHKATDWLTVDFNSSFGSVTQNGISGSGGSTGNFAAPQYAAPMMLPFSPIYNEDGSFNAPVSGLPGDMRHNPIFATEANDIKSRSRAFVGNTAFTATITDDLSFKSFYGLDYRAVFAGYYTDPRTIDGFARQGLLQLNQNENINFITNQTFNYNKVIQDKHSISGILGAEYRSDTRDYNFSSGEGFPTFQFRTMQAAATPVNVTGYWTGFKRVGFFGQGNYDYAKKYFLSAVLRYDGSSRFGANHQFGWFPSVSGAWAIDQEDFLKNQNWIDQLKLRLSYGETGNDQVDNFASRGLYSGTGAYNGLPGIRPNSIENLDLRWERNVTYNIGLDIGLFDNRLAFTAEAFRRISKDLLLEQPLPYTSGYDNITRNLGELRNQGLEFSLNSRNIQSTAFSWTTNFNISFIDNKVTSLYDDLDVLPGDQTIRVGSPLYSYFQAQYAGVNAATGKAMWYDGNGDITYNPVSPADWRVYGSMLSDFYGGFTNTFTYKGIELSAFFQYDYGRDLYNTQNTFWFRNAATIRNGLEETFLNRWTNPGQITSTPRPIDGGSEANMASQYRSSSRFLEDASYIRLKTVTLAYALPAHIVSKINARQVRIYAQGVNLLTWTKWSGYDPEFIIEQQTGANFTSNQGAIPPLRSYTLGVQVGF